MKTIGHGNFNGEKCTIEADENGKLETKRKNPPPDYVPMYWQSREGVCGPIETKLSGVMR